MTFDAPDSPEAAYLARATKAHRRRFAQVLTPPDCAALMADWVAGARPATLLDPAFGTGVLARAVAALLLGVWLRKRIPFQRFRQLSLLILALLALMMLYKSLGSLI